MIINAPEKATTTIVAQQYTQTETLQNCIQLRLVCDLQ